MGFRFRKSMKIAPGVRVNFSTRGAGLSVGPRGASVSIGSRGIYGNVGVPGTGLSYRSRLDSGGGRGQAPSAAAASSVGGKIKISLHDSGDISWEDLAGNPLPASLVARLKKERGDELRAWLAEKCENWNQGIDQILRFHLGTPAPDPGRAFLHVPFAESAPVRVPDQKPGFLARFIRSMGEKVQRENAARVKTYELSLSEWNARKVAHETREESLRQLFESAHGGDPEAMQELLEYALAEIDWPRETSLSFDVTPGAAVAIDVDLPEIEDLPQEEASVSGRAYKITVKARSESQRRREYAAHIHAIAFRVVGEVFALLPTVQTVTISGYSQRASKATGQENDEYLLSSRVSRVSWQGVHFGRVSEVDPVEFFTERTELRRKMTKTGVFSPIEPFIA